MPLSREMRDRLLKRPPTTITELNRNIRSLSQYISRLNNTSPEWANLMVHLLEDKAMLEFIKSGEIKELSVNAVNPLVDLILKRDDDAKPE